MASSSHVFISYSHESDAHRQTVFELANRLRAEGVDAMMDLYAEAPPEGWPRWVERQVSQSDFVLCVCSELYRTGFEGRNDGAKGLGVNQEGFLILQDLYENGNKSSRYIPIYFTNDGSGVIPGALKPFQRYRLPFEYDQLYSRLTHQPAIQVPALGQLRPSAPAVAPLEPQSNGFEQKADVSAHILPTQQPIERLAPGLGLHLSRIINPQPEGGRLTTVWVAARGPRDYVLDSVRIRHKLGGLLGPVPPPVALAPDAAYRITFPTGSDAVYPLDPPLMVGPATRNWAWFTFSATRDNRELHSLEKATIWLQYQTTDGSQGTLVLQPVPAPAARLAMIIDGDLLYTWDTDGRSNLASMTVTREGLQRGLEQGSAPAASYAAIRLQETNWFSRITRDTVLLYRRSTADSLRVRSALHDLLRRLEARARLSDWLDEASLDAADLTGSLADAQSAGQLMHLLDIGQKDVALQGLIVRHLACGDDVLSNLALHRSQDLDSRDVAKILTALLIKPTPASMQVFASFRQASPGSAWFIVKALYEDLSDADRNLWLDLPGGPLGTDLFLYGSMNAWTAVDAAKLVYHGEGLYRVVYPLTAGSCEIKFSDTKWLQANLGAPDRAPALQVGQSTGLLDSRVSGNIVLDVPADGLYLFEIDTSPFQRITLTFAPSEGASPSQPADQPA